LLKSGQDALKFNPQGAESMQQIGEKAYAFFQVISCKLRALFFQFYQLSEQIMKNMRKSLGHFFKQ